MIKNARFICLIFCSTAIFSFSYSAIAEIVKSQKILIEKLSEANPIRNCIMQSEGVIEHKKEHEAFPTHISYKSGDLGKDLIFIGIEKCITDYLGPQSSSLDEALLKLTVIREIDEMFDDRLDFSSIWFSEVREEIRANMNLDNFDYNVCLNMSSYYNDQVKCFEQAIAASNLDLANNPEDVYTCMKYGARTFSRNVKRDGPGDFTLLAAPHLESCNPGSPSREDN